MRNLGLSFKYAFEGLFYVLRSQRNARIHLLLTLCVTFVGFWLGIGARDWAVLVLAMMIVWAAEFFNTAMEALVDLVSPEKKHLAKVAKDAAAAAVLVAAFGAIIIGLLTLGPPLAAKLF